MVAGIPTSQDTHNVKDAKTRQHTRGAEKLTDAGIRGVALPHGQKVLKVADGKGLCLVVTRREDGTLRKVWRLRYRLKVAVGEASTLRETEHTIGEYPDVPLTGAREERARLAKIIKAGESPAQHQIMQDDKHAAVRAATFAAVEKAWLASLDVQPATLRQYTNALKQHLPATFRDERRPIATITAGMIGEALRKSAKRRASGKGTMAALLLQCLEGIFHRAVELGHIEHAQDPTLHHQRKRPFKTKETEHHKPLEAKAVGSYLRSVSEFADPMGRRAMRLAFLTLARSKEIIEGRWDEVDWNKALWTIPGARMKMGKPHTIPLSTQAVALLRELKAAAGTSPCIFPNRDDNTKPAARNKLYRMSVALDTDFTPHGIRATGSTLLNGGLDMQAPGAAGAHAQLVAFPSDWIERQLAHAETNKTKRSYNQNDYVEQRRGMMQTWADWLDLQEHGAPAEAAKGGNVIDLPRRRTAK